jgi:hypothetical protein
MSEPNDIVGHKTFRDGSGFRHEPLTRAEADAFWQRAEGAKRERAVKYPTEEDAVRGLWEAWYRLTELGWKDPIYAPMDRKLRLTVSLGSTGIHKAYCEQRSQHPISLGKWWWHPSDDGDLWPHDPILYRDEQP